MCEILCADSLPRFFYPCAHGLIAAARVSLLTKALPAKNVAATCLRRRGDAVHVLGACGRSGEHFLTRDMGRGLKVSATNLRGGVRIDRVCFLSFGFEIFLRG